VEAVAVIIGAVAVELAVTEQNTLQILVVVVEVSLLEVLVAQVLTA
jgi:hypothetical protein